MTSKENLEEKLHQLSQAISSDDNLVENVMNRIPSVPAWNETKAGHIKRIIMKHSLIKLTTAAAIAIVVCITISYFSGNVDGTSAVYAAAIKALQNVNTVHVTGWTTRIHPRHIIVGDKPFDTTKRYPIEIWEWFSEDGLYRMFEREGPITVWQDEDWRYVYQAFNDILHIDKSRPYRLSTHFQFLVREIESFQKHGDKMTIRADRITFLVDRVIGSRKAQGFQLDNDIRREEIWFDNETQLILEINAYVLDDGQWKQWRHGVCTYDQEVPANIREYAPPDAKRVEYSSDIDPKYEEYHSRLREIAAYYKEHPLPETMELLPRENGEKLDDWYSPGRLSGITDTTGYWVLPVQSSLGDFLRSKMPYGSLRVPKDLKKIELNHDLITNYEHTSRQRADFVLDALGLELVEVNEQRKVWIAHYDGRPLKPWQQVKAPVARGDARHMKPGMDFNSNPHSMRHLLESFAYYQDYDLTAKQTIIIDETGLPSESVESPFDESIAVSSASPYWHGDKIIETARQWFKEQFGVTFIEETRLMTVYVVRKREQM